MSTYSKGMTLIEAIVWVAVFTSAMLALTTSVQYFYRTSSHAIQEASATVSAQRGVDLLVRTIREASYASNGAYPIVSIAPDNLVFYADKDTDPLVEELHYYVSDTTLKLGVIDPSGDPPSYANPEATSNISDYVQNNVQGVSLFTYYDKNGTEITDYTKRGDVRFVTVNLLVDVDPLRTPTIITLRSSASMRNLIGK
ncbi:type II secretion system protein [Candidatus Kaiserbacteria bacterium]|nr:type II secretion system protein [Candidatus Kaiserbacteria bacterium]